MNIGFDIKNIQKRKGDTMKSNSDLCSNYRISLEKLDMKWRRSFMRELNKKLCIKDVDDFLKVTYKGYEFSIVPFAVNGFSFIKGQSFCYEILNLLISSLDKPEDIFEYNGDKVKDILGEENYYVSLSLLKDYDTCGKEALSLLYKDKYLFADYIMRTFMYECLLISDGLRCDDYDKKAYNTQAFSYYLTLYWVLQKSNVIRLSLGRFINKIDFKELLDSFLPDNSYFEQYFKKEISAKTLYTKVNSYISDKPYSIKEEEILFSCGLVNEDLLKNKELSTLVLRLVNLVKYKEDISSVKFMVANSYFETGEYIKKMDELEALNNEIRGIKEDLKASNKQLTEANKELVIRNKKIKELESDIEKIGISSDEYKYKDTISKLSSKIKALFLKLDKKDIEISELEKKRLELVHEVSDKKKEIKQLKARLDEMNKEDSKNVESSSDIEVENEDDFPNIIKFLSDKKIILAGGLNKNLVSELKNLGISNVKQYIERAPKNLGYFDCVVVLADYAPHCVSIPLKDSARMCDKPFIYANGINPSLICRQIYDNLKDTVDA